MNVKPATLLLLAAILPGCAESAPPATAPGDGIRVVQVLHEGL